MELVQYLRLFRKWWWLIALAAFVTGSIAFIISVRQPPIYRAQTTVSIGRYIESPNPNASDIRLGLDLVRTYERLVTTFDILQGTITRLALPLSPEILERLIRTDIVTGTSLLVITVTYNDPILAADLANTLAEELITNSPTNLTAEQQTQLDFLNAQIQALSGQILESRAQLDSLNGDIQSATTQTEIQRLTTQRNATIDQINDAQATIAQYTNTVATLQQRSNALDIVERARTATRQEGPGSLASILAGAMLGAVLAGGAVLVIEFLDDTLRNTEEIVQILGLPVLGAVVRFGKKAKRHSDMLLTHYPTMSPIAEGYRSARTNLLFAENRGQKAAFIITSPNPQEGKTITTSNLAVVMAQAGLNVLLIDADLRRPMIHQVFGLHNEVGLTTLLQTDPPASNGSGNGFAERSLLSANFLRCVQNTDIPQLRVLTSGFIPSNPSEVLGSVTMKRWIEAFRASPTIDIVIIDSPPTLAVADSQVLAAATGAEVVLVVDCGRTRRLAAVKAKDLFSNLDINLKGVIANRVNPRDEYYGYYYGYYTSSSRVPQNGMHEPAAVEPDQNIQ